VPEEEFEALEDEAAATAGGDDLGFD